MRDNWRLVCDKVSQTKDLKEMAFEKGIATIILSGLGWNDFNDNLSEQYVIKDHIKEYRPDFALFPEGREGKPGILVELKKTGHKQRQKDIIQIRTYMMLTDIRFCLYFGEKMELFYIDVRKGHREVKSVLTLNYDKNNPEGNRLINLLTYDKFNFDDLMEYCKNQLELDETVQYYTSEEGRKAIFNMMATHRNLSKKVADLLPLVLTAPERKENIIENIGEKTDNPKPVTTQEQPAKSPRKNKHKTTDSPNVWLIPSNKRRFDLEGCFAEFGEVYWTMNNNYQQMKSGDTGYVYSADPDKAIIFRFEVIYAHLSYKPDMDKDDRFSKTPVDKTKRMKQKFSLIRMTGKADKSALPLRKLVENGMKGAPQSAMIISKEQYSQLLNYIDARFSEKEKQESKEVKGIVFTQEMKQAGGSCRMTFYPGKNIYVINKGSNILDKSFESCGKGMITYRDTVKASMFLARKEGDMYTLLDDIILPAQFSSPSGASKFCWGTSRPGPNDWQDEDGKRYPTEWWKSKNNK